MNSQYVANYFNEVRGENLNPTDEPILKFLKNFGQTEKDSILKEEFMAYYKVMI
jgi:hypothetical protein